MVIKIPRSLQKETHKFFLHQEPLNLEEHALTLLDHCQSSIYFLSSILLTVSVKSSWKTVLWLFADQKQ